MRLSVLKLMSAFVRRHFNKYQKRPKIFKFTKQLNFLIPFDNYFN